MLEGAVKITNLDAKEIFQPMNMDRLWKCNLWKENERKKKTPTGLKTQKGGLGKS